MTKLIELDAALAAVGCGIDGCPCDGTDGVRALRVLPTFPAEGLALAEAVEAVDALIRTHSNKGCDYCTLCDAELPYKGERKHKDDCALAAYRAAKGDS